jgi:cyclophilin family peptidyl-prolyl cis-trans isomerase
MEELRRAQQASHKRRRYLTIGGAVLILFIAFLIFSGVFSGSPKNKLATTATTVAGSGTTATTAAPPPTAAPVPAGAKITGVTPCPKADGSSPRTSLFAKAPPNCLDPGKSYTATFNTTEGKIVVALDTKTTPITANNFIVLSRYRFYDGSAIFRTDTSIDILQGGGPTTQSPSDPGPGYTIQDEGAPPRHYKAGDLVMARTSAPNSAGSEFFLVAGPKASNLDSQGTYVTFGSVTTGLDVVKKIEGLSVGAGQLGGAPSRVVTIKTLTITET